MIRWFDTKIKCFGARPCGAKAGFTILELMIVVTIISALVAIAALNGENLVYRSHANRVADLLVSDLHLAKMTAMRAKQEVTVAFNQPGDGQYTVSWADGNFTEVRQLDTGGRRVEFLDSPPGSSPAPDESFVFNQLGFAEPSSGSLVGNIYLNDTKNGTIFRIATTPAGSIEKRRWLDSDSDWEGTPLTYTP